MNWLTTLWEFVKNHSSVTHTESRTGTKIAWAWLVFSGVLITWLLVGVPILSIQFPQLLKYAEYTSNIILALTGSASIVYGVNETRKTIENSKETTKITETNGK